MKMKVQYLENGKALNGHDAVSVYNGETVLGKEKLRSSYLNAIYQFATESNKNEFDQNPEKYIPKYGGYCSIAVSEGVLVESNAHSALVQDGELHVFYKDVNEDTQDEWNEKPIESKKMAEDHWIKLKG
jgi:YHS domain-containing protein